MVKLFALLLVFLPAVAQASCRQALSLLYVSGSVDRHECGLQFRGLANALNSEDVRLAFLAMPGAPVKLHIFVWAGRGGPRAFLDWREIGSGDGKSNTGFGPRYVKNMGLLSVVAVNALVVDTDKYHGVDPRAGGLGGLAHYFQSDVIRDPQAFVQTATSFVDFETAMQKKLLNEWQTIVVAENRGAGR